MRTSSPPLTSLPASLPARTPLLPEILEEFLLTKGSLSNPQITHDTTIHDRNNDTLPTSFEPTIHIAVCWFCRRRSVGKQRVEIRQCKSGVFARGHNGQIEVWWTWAAFGERGTGLIDMIEDTRALQVRLRWLDLRRRGIVERNEGQTAVDVLCYVLALYAKQWKEANGSFGIVLGGRAGRAVGDRETC
jgi:hypothetical protein